jgi:hypothetical protein
MRSSCEVYDGNIMNDSLEHKTQLPHKNDLGKVTKCYQINDKVNFKFKWNYLSIIYITWLDLTKLTCLFVGWYSVKLLK